MLYNIGRFSTGIMFIRVILMCFSGCQPTAGGKNIVLCLQILNFDKKLALIMLIPVVFSIKTALKPLKNSRLRRALNKYIRIFS